MRMMGFLRLASFLLILIPLSAQANNLIINTGMQMETITLDSGKNADRTSIGSVAIEYEFDIHKKLTIGIIGGSATSLTTQEILSFGIGAYANYFFKGQHGFTEFKRNDVSAKGISGKWAYFAGGGVEQRLLNSSEISSETKGGIFIRGGARRIWNENVFFQGYARYLLGGAEYTSLDLFVGIGFYL